DPARHRTHLGRARVQGGARAHGGRRDAVRSVDDRGRYCAGVGDGAHRSSGEWKAADPRPSVVSDADSAVGVGRLTGVILAGGQATRYGGKPKGLERVGGQRIIDRVADVLARVTDDLLLIANDPGANDWLPGIRCASDVRPGVGSL